MTADVMKSKLRNFPAAKLSLKLLAAAT